MKRKSLSKRHEQLVIRIVDSINRISHKCAFLRCALIIG